MTASVPKAGSRRRKRRQRGASLVECALIVCLVAMVAVPSLMRLGTATSSVFTEVGEYIETGMPGGGTGFGDGSGDDDDNGSSSSAG